jgi:hypothetical protein
MSREEIIGRRVAARRRLLAAVEGCDEETMTTARVCGRWTARDVLAHVSGWARWDLETIRALLAGEDAELAVLDDVDGFNDRLVTERGGWSVERVLEEMEEIEAATNQFIADLPEERLLGSAPFVCQYWRTLADWLLVAWEHEEEHAAELETWRASKGSL